MAKSTTAEAERLGKTSVGVEVEQLAAIYALESVRFFGPVKFRELYEANVSPTDALERPDDLPLKGQRGKTLIEAVGHLTASARELAAKRAVKQVTVAQDLGAQILTYAHPSYPRHVFDSNDPQPVIYALGNLSIIEDKPPTVALVGSRKIREPYSGLHTRLAEIATASGFTVVSGFALGADTLGHRAAVEGGGSTICVMPCGLDRPFPPENRSLWREFREAPRVAMVSEFPFGTAASSLTLRKRNKLIVAFARGVVVSQSSSTGGAMNAYRFALEQHKPIATFEDDGATDTSGNRVISSDSAAEKLVFPREQRGAEEELRGWLSRLSSST